MRRFYFKAAIENGADMIMTAHITYPRIDEEVTFGDGTTKGFYPATMSRKMMTDILRTDLGFGGVIITDALEMDAIRTAGLVPGDTNSAEYSVNIAEKVINAGVDLLLLPADLKSPQAAAFYDDYISGIAAKVAAGEISETRIDESVRRILTLKSKYGIFDVGGDGKAGRTSGDLGTMVKNSAAVVGSEAHHAVEMDMARKAITLVKNDRELLPLSGGEKSIVVLCRLESDKVALRYAMEEMKKEGRIGENTEIFIDYYYNASAEDKLHYTDEMKEKIKAADAIILAYMGSGLRIDPTEKLNNTGMAAVNANIIAAVETVFGCNRPAGKLPVNITIVEEDADGNLSYGTKILYERGFGLVYP